MNELALFAGAGGGILGGQLLGWRTVCAVESDAYCCRVLAQRQDDGCLEPFPIWNDDIRDFDGRAWAGTVDVVSGGFPCTDISTAGGGAGIDGEQSGLWKEMVRIIGEVRPRYCFVENSPVLTARGLGTVLGDLAALGFDAEWGVVGANASSLGAPHIRKRIWIVADSSRKRGEVRERVPVEGSPTGPREHDEEQVRGDELADAESARLEGQEREPRQSEVAEPRSDGSPRIPVDAVPRLRELLVRGSQDARARLRLSVSRGMEHEPIFDWWLLEPNVGRVANGVAHRVDRLRANGNGQVPSVAALAWTLLLDRLHARPPC